MIQRQPQRPRVVIESQREADADNEQNRQHDLLIKTREGNAREIEYDDENFRRDHVRHNRADKKSFFAFEDYPTSVTAVFEIEGPRDDRGAATGRTLQFERSPDRKANPGSVHCESTARAFITGDLELASLQFA